ncbi:MAG TPA: polyamine aminopropyltransferase [Dehalococcoidia bacterium]|nr:polyamine aminopropyltransferase [Dehalococcoidia bacterium]
MPHFFREKDPFAPIEYGYKVEEVLYQRKTKHHKLLIFKSPYFGKVLALNGVVQLTERDEHFYHEMLAQVALHAHPSPTDVLIIGGGDGGTLREVLKHEVVERALVVELDREVIETSKEFFPTPSTGFADSRTQIVEMGGAEFLAQTREKFDLIIVDSTDPVGPTQSLFTSQLFTNAFSALKAEGIFTAQTESLHFHQEFIRDVQHRLAQIFNLVDLYTVPLATYAGNWWTFSIASKVHNPKEVLRKCAVSTKYYSEDVHRHAFLPQSLYQKLMSDKV